MNTYAIDFETYYDNECSVRKLGNRGYFSHYDFEAYLVTVVGSDGFSFTGDPRQFDWTVLTGNRVLSHNASFDESLYLYGVKQNWWVACSPAEWHCTADLAAYAGLPRNLKGAAQEALGVELSKDTRDKMKGKRWASMDPEFQQEVLAYATKDAELCLRLWEKLSPEWPQAEREHSVLTRKICRHGIPVDEGLVKTNAEKLRVALWEAEQSIPWRDTGALLSRKESNLACRAAGIDPPKSWAMGDPECEEWLDKNAEKFPWVYAVRNWRRMNSLLKKVEAFDAGTVDGRYYGGLMYWGAHCVTGDHEVLTPQGWVKISDWSGGTIACYDPADQSITLQESTANKFRCTQPLYEIDAPYYKGVFTAGHTMPRLHGKTLNPIPAKCGDLAFMSQVKLVTGGKFVNPVGALGAKEMRVLVAVQADGHWPRVEHSGRCVQFTLRKERKCVRLEKLLTDAGISWTKHSFPSAPTQYRYTIRRVDIPLWLTEDRKQFGPWVLEASTEGMAAAVDELQYWDSHVSQYDKEYYTTNRDSYEWAQVMVHLSGGTAMPRKTQPARGNRVSCYQFGFREKGNAQVYSKHWSEATAQSRYVYCPTTPTGYWVYRYNGTIAITGNTGRWSGSGGNLNLQNLPRGDMFGVNLREQIRCADDKRLVIVDLSQIEVRTLCWLAEDHETLAEIAASDDIYEAFAVRFELWSKGQGSLKANDAALRHKVKGMVLGCGYGASAKKYQLIMDVPQQEAEAAVSLYQQKMSKVCALWRKYRRLTETAKEGNDLSIDLPSGNKITYRNICRNTEAVNCMVVKNGKNILVRPWYGMITENVSQKLARDIFAHQLKKLDDAGHKIILHVHDEVVIEAPAADAERTLADALKIMCTPPDWIPDIPLSADGQISQYYTK
jgi:hypothetical protein